ncbi:uncharacterized protein [Periplaneta americana]|uniref:uncharacterized protein isoform X5 n=1 Tax=Periplaneta americana TaxID=6978 RepID=UPI0037E7B99D
MPLTQREVIQLGLLFLCVPAQYLLSGNIGTGAGRSQAVLQLVNEFKSLHDSWLKLESWKLRWLRFVSWILRAIIQPDDSSHKYENESPAVEVMRFREQAGYFATSLEVREERPSHLRFRVGQVVRHRTLGYRGVIVGWDLQAKTLRNWPHYAILVDDRDYSGSRMTYVVQEQLELLKNTEVRGSILVWIITYSCLYNL